MMIVFALILLFHGIAHMVGFLGSWQLEASVPYKTTILAGNVDVGDTGVRVLGVIWLALAIAFAVTAVAAFARFSWWPAAALLLSTISLLMCVIEWPQAQAGAALNVALIMMMFSAMRFGWFDLVTR
jgi:hypothetical protein